MTIEVPRVITAATFLDALRDADVTRPGERIRRVIIDAEYGQALRLYVERWGDTRMLELARTLEGVEIREVDREHASAS